MSWVARFSTNMQEIRFVFNPSVHTGTSKFIENNYHTIKRLNPRFPFLVRENPGVAKSIMTCRFDYGGEAERDITGKTAQEIRDELQQLVELGNHTVKANLYPWQESSNQDVDILDYDPHDPYMHHI